jgi:hypothetical protein
VTIRSVVFRPGRVDAEQMKNLVMKIYARSSFVNVQLRQTSCLINHSRTVNNGRFAYDLTEREMNGYLGRSKARLNLTLNDS